MGKEISTLAELNQYEAINHKSQIRLWLHDVVDGVVTPGLLTVENLIAGVTLGLDDLYAASDHNHDSDYADIAHNHDSDYADIAHNHDSDYADIAHNHDGDYVPYNQGMGVMTASWVGNNTTPRTINLNYDVAVTTPLLIICASWQNASTYGLRLWFSPFSSGFFYVLSGSGCAIDAAQWTYNGSSSIEVVQNINLSSWYYRLFMLGWRTTS